MVTIAKQPSRGAVTLGKQLNYQEVIDLLDKQWSVNRTAASLDRIKQLDAAVGYPSKSLNTILVTGTNGKSLTLHFTTKLLREEGLTVGTYYSPHILTYNERIAVNHDSIINKTFTDVANEVLAAAHNLDTEAHSSELLFVMALLYFKQSNVDVALIEVDDEERWTPATLCSSKITAITRIISDNQEQFETTLNTTMNLVQKDTFVVSADQSKLHLQLMSDKVQEHQATWIMPIRKLAPLSYPLEQLHGRCAALAERVAQLYVEHFAAKHATVIADSLLIKPKGQRGRPTLEAKRQSELNPKRTLEQFWREESSSLPGRFQLLDKEKPSILLDTADNVDALKNLFLGIRLLHYKRPLKGLTIIIGAHKDTFATQEFLKLARYFFKKTSGSLIFFPIEDPVTGSVTHEPLDTEKITNEVRNLKIKAKAAKNFKEAFELAKKNVDERHGLVVITGSSAALNEYWNYKGIKKL